MSDALKFNTAWVGGVHLPNIQSGDVSALEKELRTAKEEGGGWVQFQFQGGEYVIYVAPDTDVVLQYIDY